MKCSVCGAEVADGAAFCTVCGASMAAPAQEAAPVVEPTPAPIPTPDPVYNYDPTQTPYAEAPVEPTDHTAEYDPKDISDNKVIAMLPYLMSTIGVIIALLASKESPYVGFHVRQALKIQVTMVLVAIVTVILCWTVIVPILGLICLLILLIVNIICFFSVCCGNAKEAPIVRSFGFLK